MRVAFVFAGSGGWTESTPILERILEEAARYLDEDGVLVVAAPNVGCLPNWFYKKFPDDSRVVLRPLSALDEHAVPQEAKVLFTDYIPEGRKLALVCSASDLTEVTLLAHGSGYEGLQIEVHSVTLQKDEGATTEVENIAVSRDLAGSTVERTKLPRALKAKPPIEHKAAAATPSPGRAHPIDARPVNARGMSEATTPDTADHVASPISTTMRRLCQTLRGLTGIRRQKAGA